jgi:hypothetical protein
MSLVWRFITLLLLFVVPYSTSFCQSNCYGHGICDDIDRCQCYKNRNGEPLYTGNDCSLLTCPKGVAWLGSVTKANDLHPVVECSNMGKCNRQTGVCECYYERDGIACERAMCPNDCNGNGVCYTQKQLADEVGRVYDTPWDANKMVACICDVGYRGLDCKSIECPSNTDVSKGHGNEKGRECSGRGICDYAKGLCSCFVGYYGVACDKITTLI